MAFDAGLLSHIVNEISCRVTGARLEKIYQPTRDEIVLDLRAAGDSVRLLINGGASNPRINLTSEKSDNPPVPPLFCTVLRKHLSSAKLTSVTQLGFERAVRLTFDAHDELGFVSTKHIIAEIMGKYSNIILTDADDRIIGVLKSIDFTTSSKRQVLCGMTYELPPAQDKANPLTVGEADFNKKCAACDADRPCDKFITSSFLGISPLIAREIVYRCTGSTSSTLDACAPSLWREFSRIMDEIRTSGGTPCLISGETRPIEYTFTDITQYASSAKVTHPDTFGELIDTYFMSRATLDRMHQRAADIVRLLTNAESRVTKKIALQSAELEKCAESGKYRVAGDLITANIYRLTRGMTHAVLDNYYDGSSIDVTLDARLTPSQNAQRYYKKYNKAKSAKEHLTVQLEEARRELEYLSTVSDALTRCETEKEIREIRSELYHSGYASKLKNYSEKKNEKPTVLHFVTSGGRKVSVGKNNIANDWLTFRYAEKTDWWFHVKNMPGSHVIMEEGGEGEPSAEDFTEAATIAAVYSKAPVGSTAEVDYTRVRFVKKPPSSKPGYVIYHTNWSANVTADRALAESLKSDVRQ